MGRSVLLVPSRHLISSFAKSLASDDPTSFFVHTFSNFLSHFNAVCFLFCTLLTLRDTTHTYVSAASLPVNAGIIYPIEYNQLSFCSQINYTVFLELTLQSQFNASKKFDTPVVELPTQTAVPIHENGAPYATTDYIFNDGYFPNRTEFSDRIIDINTLDKDAESMYNTVYGILQRYNCRDFYPYHSCNRCLEYYKNWACAVTFPLWNESAPYKAGSAKMCEDVCWEVVRKCPVELEFYCPTHDDTFATVSDGCNSLGLNLTSSAVSMTHFGWIGAADGGGSTTSLLFNRILQFTPFIVMSAVIAAL